MRLLVYGAGAVGGYVGGKLAAAGHAVVCLARPRIAEAINARGLIVRDGGGERIARARAVTSAAEAFSGAPFDFVVFAMKSNDTAAAIKELRAANPLSPTNPLPMPLPMPLPILCLQNGVDNEPALAAAFGAENVIAGTLTTAVSTDEPGIIVVERERGFGVALGHPCAPGIAAALESAGLLTLTYPAAQAPALKWTKLLTNLIANATSAITDLPPAAVYAHPGLYRLEVAMLRECLAVMRAKRIPLVNLPRLPARLFGALLRYLPPGLYQRLLARMVVTGRGSKMPSFHIALSQGQKRTEVEYLHGAVARHGAEAGVPTPVCQLLTDTLMKIAAGEAAWEEYRGRPERLV